MLAGFALAMTDGDPKKVRQLIAKARAFAVSRAEPSPVVRMRCVADDKHLQHEACRAVAWLDASAAVFEVTRGA